MEGALTELTAAAAAAGGGGGSDADAEDEGEGRGSDGDDDDDRTGGAGGASHALPPPSSMGGAGGPSSASSSGLHPTPAAAAVPPSSRGRVRPHGHSPSATEPLLGSGTAIPSETTRKFLPGANHPDDDEDGDRNIGEHSMLLVPPRYPSGPARRASPRRVSGGPPPPAATFSSRTGSDGAAASEWSAAVAAGARRRPPLQSVPPPAPSAAETAVQRRTARLPSVAPKSHQGAGASLGATRFGGGGGNGAGGTLLYRSSAASGSALDLLGSGAGYESVDSSRCEGRGEVWIGSGLGFTAAPIATGLRCVFPSVTVNSWPHFCHSPYTSRCSHQCPCSHHCLCSKVPQPEASSPVGRDAPEPPRHLGAGRR